MPLSSGRSKSYIVPCSKTPSGNNAFVVNPSLVLVCACLAVRLGLHGCCCVRVRVGAMHQSSGVRNHVHFRLQLPAQQSLPSSLEKFCTRFFDKHAVTTSSTQEQRFLNDLAHLTCSIRDIVSELWCLAFCTFLTGRKRTEDRARRCSTLFFSDHNPKFVDKQHVHRSPALLPNPKKQQAGGHAAEKFRRRSSDQVRLSPTPACRASLLHGA